MSTDVLSPASIVAIIVGSLVAFSLLAWYLFSRHRRHSFSRVANPALDLPRIHSRTVKDVTSLSNHYISPAAWPPIPPVTPPRSDSPSPSPDVHAQVSRVIAAARSTPPLPPNSDPQSYFIHRMLQSRAHASEGLVRRPSLSSVQSPTETVHSVDDQAERTALIHAQLEDREDSTSIYSQPSALDHALSPFDPVSRQKSSKSSRAQFATELPTVTEVPSMSSSRPVSMVAPSSLDAQLSHITPSDQPTHFPLLSSANFGKESTTTAGSISSNMGSSSGRPSRYPSITPSTILSSSSSHSGPLSEARTDWRHPPPGLSGLKTLQLGPLPSPHSPVQEHPTVEPMKQARLRQGTASSIPEVEHRSVMQSDIARIDVAL